MRSFLLNKYEENKIKNILKGALEKTAEEYKDILNEEPRYFLHSEDDVKHILFFI